MKKTNKRQSSRRHGVTTVTSVSVSPYFKKIMESHNFSPTEVFRRGVASMLHDIGELGYQTDLNKSRSEFIDAFFDDLRKDTVKKEMFQKAVTIAHDTIILEAFLKSTEEEDGV